MRLEGKVAIVTGAGSGFGAGIARKFAEEGARVAVVDVNAEGGTAVADDIRAHYGKDAARFFRCDVTQRADIAQTIRAMVDAHGKVDAFVNNAGITHPNRPVQDVEEHWFERIFAVNVKSIFLSAQELIPVFQSAGGGSIINVASTGGIRPRPGLAVYNASKGAAIALTKALAIELAPLNIRVTAVNPVAGETPLLATFMGADTPELREKFRSTVPLGRLSTPRDIANTVAFLASDEAAFLTGVAVEVDGGRCI
ncbi:MAG: glucose 1-dehydrogenase [Vulcanimicrobiaceae bacterium]